MIYTPFFYIGNRKAGPRARLTEFHNNAFSGETPKIPVRRQHGTAGNGQVFGASQKAPEDRPNPGGYGFFSVLSAGDGLANGNFYMIFSFSSGRNTGNLNSQCFVILRLLFFCYAAEISFPAADASESGMSNTEQTVRFLCNRVKTAFHVMQNNIIRLTYFSVRRLAERPDRRGKREHPDG